MGCIRSVSALLIVILLGILSLVGIAATARVVARDGYRQIPLDRSRLP